MADEKDLAEVLNTMAREWRERAEAKGMSVDWDNPSQASSKEEAYILGRFDQMLSVMDELEIESDEIV